MIGIGRLLIPCLSMVCGFSSVGNAQQIAAQLTRSMIPHQKTTSSRTALERPITIQIINEPLSAAVRIIAQTAGLTLFYTEELLPTNRQVTLTMREVPARQVLEAALRGTDIDLAIAPNGNIALAKRGVPTVRRHQVGTVTGRVTDKANGRPIVGATIAVEGAARGTQTDGTGSYRITGLPSGKQVLHVRRIGYVTQQRSITIADAAATADFEMSASASVLDQVVVTGTIIETEQKSVPNAMTVVTAKQIEERGITRIDQLFRGDIPGMFARNDGSWSPFNEVTMFSRGSTGIPQSFGSFSLSSNPIKTYVDGVEMADPKYLSQIDPRSIERIEILTGPQASTIYGSNAINGVMQIFTKRGVSRRPEILVSLMSGLIQNNYNDALTPMHAHDATLTGTEGRWGYNVGVSWDHQGRWTPAKQTERLSEYGGGRFQSGTLVLDGSVRLGETKNRRRGNQDQTIIDMMNRGIGYYIPEFAISDNSNGTLNGQTVGLNLSYAPLSWWSHELGVGTDVANVKTILGQPTYVRTPDTTVSVNESRVTRASQRYATTARWPLQSFAQMTIVLGGDHWRTTSSSSFVSGVSQTGPFNSTSVSRGKPGKNTGGYVQAQLGIRDALFLTYGLRAEWNPNYGDEVQPNLAPRFGVTYARELGSVTAKLRASYGRSTKPPLQDQKLAVAQTTQTTINLYGPYNSRLANPDLTPESQQGGEGGLELYFGTRGSLVITRYNQTVNDLVQTVSNVDSVRSLLPDPSPTPNLVRWPDGYTYTSQSQYLNVGSTRNQGWEFNGTLNVGPVSTSGTYSWTKSRFMGITPRYRPLLTAQQYFPGSSFTFLPEHTWSLNTRYARGRSSVGLVLNGIGFMFRYEDALRYQMSYVHRMPVFVAARMSTPPGYRAISPAYTMADLNATHRVTDNVESLLQVQNLTDYYSNDFGYSLAAMGRQTRLGVRIRVK